MANKICLLGFSGSVISLIFNTLKNLNYSDEVLILENIEVEDDVPFECNIPFHRTWHTNYKPHNNLRFAFSMMKPSIKEEVFKFFFSHYRISRSQFINILHPTLVQANNCSFDKGIYIEPGCIISPYAKIGFGVSINRGVTIGHHTTIQDFATIHPGVNIAGHCNIGSGVTIGIGSSIIDHITISDYSVIGGGSIVNKDIPEGVLAFGNPCKVVRPLV